MQMKRRDVVEGLPTPLGSTMSLKISKASQMATIEDYNQLQ